MNGQFYRDRDTLDHLVAFIGCHIAQLKDKVEEAYESMEKAKLESLEMDNQALKKKVENLESNSSTLSQKLNETRICAGTLGRV